MTTEIKSNGSKWAGETPDPIEALFTRLQKHTLDCRYNGSAKMPDGTIQFWGNFIDLSAVFQIYTDDEKLIQRLRKAMTENRKRPEYNRIDNPI